MYVRSYKSLPQEQQKIEEEKPLDTLQLQPEQKPKEKKSRYKARRKIPDFHPPASEQETEDHRTPEPPNSFKTAITHIYTQSELLVLAVSILLLLDGRDDILILALGYTLCP